MERELTIWLKDIDSTRKRIAAGYTKDPWYNDSIGHYFITHIRGIPVGFLRKVRDRHAHRRR